MVLPGRPVVALGVCGMPQTLVHWSRDSVALAGTFSFGASYQYETNLQNHDLAKPALLAPLLGSTSKPGKDKNNIAPSFGFNYDVGNKGKTIIRGGAGIYYDTVLFVTRRD